jgi:hypothetical protein
VVCLLFLVPAPNWTRTEGVIWVPEEAQVRSGAEGFVTSLLVPVDGNVLRGQPLADHRVSFIPRGAELKADFDPDFERRTDAEGAEWLDLFSGRYVDRFERRDGHWRIADRVVVHDWSTSTRLDAAGSFHLPMEGFTQGCRGRSDLVYRGRP